MEFEILHLRCRGWGLCLWVYGAKQRALNGLESRLNALRDTNLAVRFLCLVLTSAHGLFAFTGTAAGLTQIHPTGKALKVSRPTLCVKK